MKLKQGKGEREGCALAREYFLLQQAGWLALPARDVIVGITGNRIRIKTNRGRIVLKARKSYSKVKFAIVYRSCLF